MVKRYHIDEDGSIGEVAQYSEPPIVVLASDYDALAAELVAAKRHIWRSGAGEAFNRIDVLEALLKRWYADPGVYMNDEELKTQQALIDDTVRALSSEQETACEFGDALKEFEGGTGPLSPQADRGAVK